MKSVATAKRFSSYAASQDLSGLEYFEAYTGDPGTLLEAVSTDKLNIIFDIKDIYLVNILDISKNFFEILSFP
jgi:hypothetical protein